MQYCHILHFHNNMILSLPILTYIDTTKIGSKIGAIQKEGPTQLKQIYIYLAISIPYILDNKEPYAFTHN